MARWVLTLLVIPSLFAGLVSAATADQWRSRRIYQVLTDRFARSDNEAASCDTGDRKYCGGTWKGITNHLDYIQNMGFDAVWISPIVANVDGAGAYGEAYHGYWTKDITQINSNFGTADDLKDLSSALHSRGMYLMVDVVVNHFALLPSSTGALDFSTNYPFSTADSFHPECFIQSTDYTQNQTAVEQCWIGDDKGPLPDLNTENQQIVQTMNNWIKNLTATYSVDGLRIDTVKHVRKDFWPDFAKASGVYTIGEVLDNRVDYSADYTKVIDALLDYPTYFAVTSAFTSNSGKLSAIVDVVTSSQKAYNNGLFYSGSFLENHDQPRFQSITKDQALVKNAMAWSFVQDGIPITYYGQEQGYDGSGDPSNREALWPTGYVTDSKPLVTHIKTLNAARTLAAKSNSNFYKTSAQFIAQQSTSALAVSKAPLLTLLTNTGSNTTSTPVTWSIPASAKLFTNNQTVMDVLSCNVVYADKDGSLNVSSDGGMPKVLVPISALSGGTLCSNVASTSAGVSLRAVSRAALIGGAALIGVLVNMS